MFFSVAEHVMILNFDQGFDYQFTSLEKPDELLRAEQEFTLLPILGSKLGSLSRESLYMANIDFVMHMHN